MNKLTIIGNLTADPELRTTPTGKNVCNFTVAANRRKKVQGRPDADFFRVAAWDQVGENCAKYLAKGRKVCVIGPVALSTYETKDGKHGANMEIFAQEVEFLSSRSDSVDQQTGMAKVQEPENPFNSSDDVPY